MFTVARSIFSTVIVFLMLTYKNMYQFKHAEQTAPDNSQLRMSL